MSSPQGPATAAAVAPPAPSKWIINPASDLTLFILTPILIIPLVLFAKERIGVLDLYIMVMAFGAVGHHLPGMLRAYGDRALFQRFKVRFIVAPIFLVSLCTYFALREENIILLAAYAWGIWHGLMQTHGFLRIYDAKVKSFGRLTAALDQWMCITWFLAAIVFSQNHLHKALGMFYVSGGSAVSMQTIETIQVVWASVTGLVTIAFFTNLIVQWKKGTPASPIKLLLMVTSISFFWFANLITKELLVGLVMFELFHDVQYLAIVWMFNRGRVDRDPNVGGFSRFLFRRKIWLVGVYLALIATYGSSSYFVGTMEVTQTKAILLGLLTASGLLHFYYDGFIWKMREKQTRANLGVEAGGEDKSRRLVLPGGVIHAMKWAFLVVPLFLLDRAWADGPMTSAQRAQALIGVAPDVAEAQYQYANARVANKDAQGALDAARRAWELDPNPELKARIRDNLGSALTQIALAELDVGDAPNAHEHLSEARSLGFEFPEGLSARLASRAEEFEKQRDFPRVAMFYRAVLAIDPDQGKAHLHLADALGSMYKWDEGLKHARRAKELLPNDEAASELINKLQSAKTLTRK